ncbi:MAG: 2-keto-4-pentenoate hydratase [Pseudomonadota bacterium]
MPLPKNNSNTQTYLAPKLDQISKALVSARLGASPLAEFPGELPATLDDAYAVQDASIARWPDRVAGWKVGMVAEELRAKLGATRLAGPIFEPTVFAIEPEETRSMSIYRGGFAAVEAEFVLQLADIIEPSGAVYSDQDLLDRIAGLHIAAEIASSPMADVNRLGPCCVVCDFGNNAGLLVGPSIADWSQRHLDELTAKTIVDDATVGAADAGVIDGGPLQALRFLVELCATRGLTLAQGTYVSCGAVTGIHDVTTDSSARLDFGVFGSFDVKFDPVQPRS